jgi:hypothetical protein
MSSKNHEANGHDLESAIIKHIYCMFHHLRDVGAKLKVAIQHPLTLYGQT